MLKVLEVLGKPAEYALMRSDTPMFIKDLIENRLKGNEAFVIVIIDIFYIRSGFMLICYFSCERIHFDWRVQDRRTVF